MFNTVCASVETGIYTIDFCINEFYFQYNISYSSTLPFGLMTVSETEENCAHALLFKKT